VGEGISLKRPTLLVVATATSCALLLAGSTRGATPPGATVSVFGGPAVAGPQGITRGPDGALWFTNTEGHSIGRITTTGTITDFTGPAISDPTAITVGPDGALWFVDGSGTIGRITTSGDVASFAASGIGSPVSIATGPDRALWFATGGKFIGRMTTDGTTSTISDPGQMRGTYGITAGPDGAMWFTNYLGSSIGRIAADGSVEIYRDPRIGFPEAIVSGPDGALWFTDDSGSIDRITTAGSLTTFGAPETVGHPQGLTVGADGALWATDRDGSIVRVTTAGAITRFASTQIQFPVGIASATDGSIWFTDYGANTVSRLVPATPAPGPAFEAVASAAVVKTRAAEVVRIPLRFARPMKVTVSVRDSVTGERVPLQPGSRIANAVATRQTAALVAAIPRAGTYVVSVALPRAIRPSTYRLVVSAPGKGKSSKIVVSFRG
jgi:virginiamycin B lyase